MVMEEIIKFELNKSKVKSAVKSKILIYSLLFVCAIRLRAVSLIYIHWKSAQSFYTLFFFCLGIVINDSIYYLMFNAFTRNSVIVINCRQIILLLFRFSSSCTAYNVFSINTNILFRTRREVLYSYIYKRTDLTNFSNVGKKDSDLYCFVWVLPLKHSNND